MDRTRPEPGSELESFLQSVRAWPADDQAELLEVGREIESRRTGVYVPSPDERAAIEEGRDQARRGEYVPDEEMEELWKSFSA